MRWDILSREFEKERTKNERKEKKTNRTKKKREGTNPFPINSTGSSARALLVSNLI